MPPPSRKRASVSQELESMALNASGSSGEEREQRTSESHPSHSVSTYSREELLAKHREAGKYRAALQAGKLRPTTSAVHQKPKKRQSRNAKRASKRKLDISSSEEEEIYVEDVTSDGEDNDDSADGLDDEVEERDASTRARATEEELRFLKARRAAAEIERAVEHGRATDMAAKFNKDAMFKDHLQIKSGSLEREYTPETTIYRIRWRGYGDDDDTFEPECNLRGDPIFEAYVKQQNFRDPGRCLMPTDKTMELVRYGLRQGGRGGQRADKALQGSFQSSQARHLYGQSKKVPGWRLVYMLLDAGILCPTAANSKLRPLVIFGQAIFYVGKGTVTRPFKHLEEARNYLLKPHSQHRQPSDCALRVADIWRSGRGVVVLPVITKLDDKDAKAREAAIISLRRIGLTNLVNTIQPNFPRLPNVNPEDWWELGVMELIKVFKLYKETEPKCCYLWDVPLKIDEIEAWYGVCPTPYRSDLAPSEPSTPSAHIPHAAGQPAERGTEPSSQVAAAQRWQWTHGSDEQVMKVRDNENYDATMVELAQSRQQGIIVIGDPRRVNMVKLHHTAAGKRFCFTSTNVPRHGASIVMWDCEESLESLATWGDDTVYSAAWDNLKCWKIVEGAIKLVDELHMQDVQGLLCVPNGENEVCCAISEPLKDPYNEGVALFDARAGLRWPPSVIVNPYDSMHFSGLAAQPGSNYVYSMDHANRLVMMDKRMMLQTVKLMVLPHKQPYNLTLSGGTLAVGQWVMSDWHAEDECAVLTNPEYLSINQEIRHFPTPTEPWRYNNHVHAKVTEGSIVVTCRDTLSIYTPGSGAKPLHSVKVDSPITRMDCLGSNTAVGMADGTIAIWQVGK